MKYKVLFLTVIITLLFTSSAYAAFTNEKNINGNKIIAGFWTPPEVEVKAPNKSETLKSGEKYSIKWKAKAPHHDKKDTITIDIYLIKMGSEETEAIVEDMKLLVEDAENDNKYDWTPTSDHIGENMLIRIVATDEYSLSKEDVSDKPFKIIN